MALVLMPGAAAAQSEFVFAVNEGVTYHITPHETRERYRDLGALLAKALNRTVRVEPVDSYPVLQKGLAERRYDLAYVHPAHHSLRAVRDQKYQLVAVTRGFTEYKAQFLTKKENKLASPVEIRGKNMVMPDPDSITAWMVRATLRDLGLDPAKETLKTTRYQDGIPFFLENGFYEIGITASNPVVKDWQSKGGLVLFASKPVPIKHLIASPNLSKNEIDRIRELFLDLDKNERGKAILATIGFRGFDSPDERALTEITKWLGI